MKITTEERPKIATAYTDYYRSMMSLGIMFGVTRQAIWKVLRAEGVDTSKRKYPVQCSMCGRIFLQHRSRLKRYRLHFCHNSCRKAWLNGIGSNYKPWASGTRMARKEVAEHFELPEGSVVHHVDGDNRNNELCNLAVFANQADHMRHHRGYSAKPIWKGESFQSTQVEG